MYKIIEMAKVDDKCRITLYGDVKKLLDVKPGEKIAFVKHGRIVGLVKLDKIGIDLKKS